MSLYLRLQLRPGKAHFEIFGGLWWCNYGAYLVSGSTMRKAYRQMLKVCPECP
jgi:hypothetical protein